MAIQLSKNGNAVKFDFDDNSHYLNDGTIEVPVNSLTLVTDESNMFTFKKAASDDIFISGLYSEIGMSKAELIAWYKDNMVGSTGGGGGGVTSGEVQTMIDESISGLAESSAVTEEISEAVSGKADTSAVTQSINAAVSGKADTSAVTASITAAVSGKQDTLIAGSGITIDSANTISCTVEGGGKTIVAGRGISVTTGATADTVSFDLPISATTAGTNNIQMLEGTNNTNSARNSLIVGGLNTVGASGVKIIGNRNTVGANCTDSFIVGSSNTNKANISGVKIIGDNNKTQSLGGGEIIIGYNNNITGGVNSSGNRIFIGEGLSAKNPKEIATGKYNVSHSGSTDADKSIFSVGNGTSSAATHNAFEIRQNGDIYITSGGTDIKLQDNLGGGVPESAFTAYTTATDARLAEDEEVTARALNDLNDKFGGMKLQSISQADYDALVSGGTVDANTLYIITNVVN